MVLSSVFCLVCQHGLIGCAMNIMYERVQELERLLSDLYEGRRVVVPHDIDHAHNMMMIAGAYIHDDKQRMWATLKQDYGVEP